MIYRSTEISVFLQIFWGIYRNKDFLLNFVEIYRNFEFSQEKSTDLFDEMEKTPTISYFLSEFINSCENFKLNFQLAAGTYYILPPFSLKQ